MDEWDMPMTEQEKRETELLREALAMNPLFGHLTIRSYRQGPQQSYLAMQEALREGRPFTRIAVYETDLV